MLAVLGERLFGCQVGSRQWVGVIMTATGLALLVLTLPHTGRSLLVRDARADGVPRRDAGRRRAADRRARLGTPAHHHGAILGAAAGTLFGVSDVALKALTTSTARSRS